MPSFSDYTSNISFAQPYSSGLAAMMLVPIQSFRVSNPQITMTHLPDAVIKLSNSHCDFVLAVPTSLFFDTESAG